MSISRSIAPLAPNFLPGDPLLRAPTAASDLHVCGAPPGIRTQNLRIKSPERTVQRVGSGALTWGSVRTVVRLALFGVPQSVQFGAKLGAETMGVIRRSSVRARAIQARRPGRRVRVQAEGLWTPI